MEVDGAPLLVLGDLGERDPGVITEVALCEAGALGDLSGVQGGIRLAAGGRSGSPSGLGDCQAAR